MQIGIIGSGIVGRSLSVALKKAGHEVKIGTAHPQKEELQQWAKDHEMLDHITSFGAAAAFGEILFLCSRWSGTKDVIDVSGKINFKGKTVIDVTNPLAEGGPDKAGRLSLDVKANTSGGEQIQNWLADSHVVKALNIIGAPLMDHPYFEEGHPTMLIAGNDEKAKKATIHLLHQLGWEDVVDMGEMAISAHLESLCVLWCAYAFRTGTWHHAFKLVRK